MSNREPWIAAIAQLQAVCGVKVDAEDTLNRILVKVQNASPDLQQVKK